MDARSASDLRSNSPSVLATSKVATKLPTTQPFSVPLCFAESVAAAFCVFRVIRGRGVFRVFRGIRGRPVFRVLRVIRGSPYSVYSV